MFLIVFTIAGGLALFLLAMAMMTDGLKLFGGAGLRVILRDWTSTPLRGAMSGALVTAVVQSSAAVTVATLGFANAGMLTLRQALAVVFGANVGTTMTGWLVAITGLGFKIDAMALPILALGVALRMAASGKRLEGLGNALAGFGLFFLGLAILQDAFGGMATEFGGQLVVADEGLVGILIYVGVGFIATVLTQSSSAAIAIILTAATQSVIGIEAAAAAIIGANVGTTSTALFAVIKATPNAKRVAIGHFAFNMVTGLVAIAVLPAFVAFVALIGSWFDVADDPAPLLALFHTVFNLMGVALLLPFTNPMAKWLEKLFHSAEEDASLPQYLDRTVLKTPVLAMDALDRELRRLASLVHGLALAALIDDRTGPERLRRRSDAIATLDEAITEFATSIRMETLPRAAAEALPRALRVSRYLASATHAARTADPLHRQVRHFQDAVARDSVATALLDASSCINILESQSEPGLQRLARDEAFAVFLNSYQRAKQSLLQSAATKALSPLDAGHALDALSQVRRLVDQIVKADQVLATSEPDPEEHDTGLEAEDNQPLALS